MHPFCCSSYFLFIILTNLTYYYFFLDYSLHELVWQLGVDPKLRAKIWNHLVELSSNGITIIITTHYIEEARQAHMVGFMRKGFILDEGPPETIMRKYNSKSLEDSFLLLCSKQEDEDEIDEDGKPRVPNTHYEEKDEDEYVVDILSINTPSTPKTSRRRKRPVTSYSSDSLSSNLISPHSPSTPDFIINNRDDISISSDSYSWLDKLVWWPRLQQTWACTWRNLKRFQNNIPGLIFLFILPSLQIILFCVAIGRNPTHLPFGIVNYDDAPNSTSTELVQAFEDTDEFSLHYYPTEDDAYDATRDNNGKYFNFIIVVSSPHLHFFFWFSP
jgi:hypothetical protein